MDQTIFQLVSKTGTAHIEGKHRYSLSRIWNKELPAIMFIGLNPSRANATYNDATIIRCINFAISWGYGGLWFGNLYSYRTPYVTRAQMKVPLLVSFKDDEVWEPLVENLHIANNLQTDLSLAEMIQNSDRVVCAWGSFDFATPRAKEVMKLIMKFKAPYCLGTNQNGSPKHPLYLSKTTQMELYVE